MKRELIRMIGTEKSALSIPLIVLISFVQMGKHSHYSGVQFANLEVLGMYRKLETSATIL